MRLEVGDYVRTKYGITQFKAYETMNGNKLLCMPVKDGSNGIFANTEDIIKSSPNIIDLIEVGDYVNGELVTNIEDVCTTDNIYIRTEIFVNHKDLIIEEDIETIVIKQQFSNMEYRL